MKPLISISESLIEESLVRAKAQESVYGHNSGHFKLQVEKENTTIGVLGELIVRNWFNDLAQARGSQLRLSQTDLGSPLDLLLVGQANKQIKGLHVKTGLWRNWPRQDFEFGIHADQGIEKSGHPLVLVSLLRGGEKWPKSSRIEGYMRSSDLSKLPIIQRGEKFASSGVISRTSNIVTNFGLYKSVAQLADSLLQI